MGIITHKNGDKKVLLHEQAQMVGTTRHTKDPI